jgi:diacylglycerol kinase family enzyme
MRQVVFVINPAGIRHLGLLMRHCQDAAYDNAWEPQFVVTEAGDTSSALVDHISADGAGPGDKLVFAVGGDGTVRACAHLLAGTGVALAMVPRGTANLFARALGIPGELMGALSTGFGDNQRLVDLAFADGVPFVAMAGIGIDAAVVESTPRLFKENLGWLGYAAAAIPHLVGPAHELTLGLDGAEPLICHARSVVVGNVGILPGGFTLLPEARLDDGLLDVAVLQPKGLLGWAGVARTVVGGRSAGSRVVHYRASRVEVSARSELSRQLDGDVIARGSSLSVHVNPKALLVRVPRG